MLLIMAVAVTACSKGKAGGDKPQIDKDKIESVGEN